MKINRIKKLNLDLQKDVTNINLQFVKQSLKKGKLLKSKHQ